MPEAYEELYQVGANFVPLSPLSFIERVAKVYPDRISVIHGDRRYTWSQTYARTRQLASALNKIGVRKGDTVAIMGANTPETYEAHFGIPMTTLPECSFLAFFSLVFLPAEINTFT